MLRFVCKQEIMEDIYAEGLFSICYIFKFLRTLAKSNLDDHYGTGDIDYENYTTTAVRPDTGEVFSHRKFRFRKKISFKFESVFQGFLLKRELITCLGYNLYKSKN